MADWVHCNTCFKQPFEIKSQFHLTNCGHIYCESCKNQVPGYCQLCKQKCSCILLTNKMKPEVEKFFTSPKDMCKQIMQVIDFQDGHRQRLVQYRRSKGTSASGGDNGSDMAQAFRELQKEYHKIKEENIHFKQAISAMRSQQGDASMMSRSSTPYSQAKMQSPMNRTPSSQQQQQPQDHRSMGMTPSSQPPQGFTFAGHTPGTTLSQNKVKTPSDRISIRTPPVGGAISTPSPCKMYKTNTNGGGYPRAQQRPQFEQGMQRPRGQNSPANSQIRSRSTTPTNSLARPTTPNRYISPCRSNQNISSQNISNQNVPNQNLNALQKITTADSTPYTPAASRTPYSSQPEPNSPMKINSSLDPAQRQIRLTYQPRVALMSQLQKPTPKQT